MDITTHDQLPDLVAELKSRWPSKFAVTRYQEITTVPARVPTSGTVLYCTTDIRDKMKKAGYWHRGFPGVDLYWRV